ncbi:sulfotransferase [Flavimaricola marinus]|uniref:Sulfotransferase domain protein n=1 Tax=Flavimaricola marinus TaxID=1819565 RepID=A0A238LDX3_9RHOB|nr:sulfotransferase [Flavimaricola marinus]SMY07782.1 hypothetical protein LOM8899_01922 [Flavimaricola marinus]
MPEQPILFCVGATKAGTSWLYRALHEHPDCALKSVKELHYWDTFDPAIRTKQIEALQGRFDSFMATKAEAQAEGRGWQVKNMQRRLRDMSGLIDVLLGDRTGDAAYLEWLTDAAAPRLVADMTPNYALLSEDVLARMVARCPEAKWVYLIRDPLDRLWSHVRMQAHRQRQPHETHEQKSNGTLWRILNKGHETHILDRGDYEATATRLRRVIPKNQLRVEFCERLFTPDGWTDMCKYLDLGVTEVDGADRAHEGPKARMKEELKPQAIRFLKRQYDWAAQELGPLPDNWQHNLARGFA